MSILTPGGSRVTLDGPASLPIVIPHLLGFHPVSSLVVIGLDADRSRVRVTCRVDIPDPVPQRGAWTALIRALRQSSAASAIVAVYPASAESLNELPHVEVVDSLVTGLNDAGFRVRDALAISGHKYRSYWCPDDGCCPEAGAEPSWEYALSLSASLVFTGSAPHGSREAIANALKPRTADDPIVRDIADRRGGMEMRLPAGSLEKVTALVDALAEPEPLSLSTLVRLTVFAAHVCVDIHVRDMFLFALTRSPDRATLARAREILSEVVRCFEGVERAGGAACLAVCAWVCGDGASARIAADIALDADPACRLAALVAIAIDRGQPPSLWTELLDHLTLEQLAAVGQPREEF